MKRLSYFDRTDAGRCLAEELVQYQGTDSVVLAVPRGGVPVACAVADELKLPLDLLLVKKIGHPSNPEYAIGAAGLDDYFVVNATQASPEYIEYAVAEIQQKLTANRNLFMEGIPPLSLRDKNVLIIDDGLATGYTLLAGVKIVQGAMPRKIVVGVPVASRSGVVLLEAEGAEVVSPLVADDFRAVGNYYSNFDQVSDEEVKEYLIRFRAQHKSK